MTPYTWRNFVNGAPMAREGQLDRFFFAKTAFHIQIVSEKAKNRTKNGQKLSKKGVFFIPHDQLAQFGQILTRSKSVRTDFDRSKPVRTDFDRVKICSNRQFGQILTGQNLFERILTGSKSVQTEPASRGG